MVRKLPRTPSPNDTTSPKSTFFVFVVCKKCFRVAALKEEAICLCGTNQHMYRIVDHPDVNTLLKARKVCIDSMVADHAILQTILEAHGRLKKK